MKEYGWKNRKRFKRKREKSSTGHALEISGAHLVAEVADLPVFKDLILIRRSAADCHVTLSLAGAIGVPSPALAVTIGGVV